MINELVAFLTTASSSSIVATFVIKTTMLLLAGLALWALLRKSSASARHLVLSTTLLTVFLLPLIAMVAPPLPVSVNAPQAASALQATALPNAPITDVAITEQTTNTASISNENPIARASRAISIGKIVLLVYAIIALAIALRLVLGIVQLRKISRDADQVSIDDDRYQLIPTSSNKTIKLLVSDQIAAPLTWGFRQPVVILPCASNKWNTQDFKNALLHEFSHVDRHDWIVQILARAICAFYWFNPLAWVAYQKLVLEAERAADDRVLLAGSVAHTYANQLVSLTSAQQPKQQLPLAATSMAAKNLLPDRVHSILNTGAHRMPLQRTQKVVLLCSLIISSVLVSSAQLVAAHGDEDDDRGVFLFAKSPTPLVRAAAVGDLQEAQRLIEAGADVNETIRVRNSTIYQRTALNTAAIAGHADMVDLLLNKGAPVDRVVRGDATALIAALKANQESVARLLINRGADTSRVVRGDGSPLIAAAMADNAAMVALLLDKGADPDDWVERDANVLFHAARNGNTKIVRHLIEAGADVNLKMRGDGNALIIATKNGHKDVVELLINAGARADSSVDGDGNALISAAQKGDVATLSLMIAAGNDVNASSRGDGSPLIAAARNGHIDATKLLLQHGASIDKVVFGDENALIGAAWAGNLEIVNLLLAAGANPNIRARTYNDNYRTALSQAKLEQHTEVISALLAAGAKE